MACDALRRVTAVAAALVLSAASLAAADDLRWKPRASASSSSTHALRSSTHDRHTTTSTAARSTATTLRPAVSSGAASGLKWRSPSRTAAAPPSGLIDLRDGARPQVSTPPRAARSMAAMHIEPQSSVRIVLTGGTEPEAPPEFDPFTAEADETPWGTPRLLVDAAQPAPAAPFGFDAAGQPPSNLDQSLGAPSDTAKLIKSCEEEYNTLKPITAITTVIDPSKGDFPPECPVKYEVFEPRHFACTTYTWKASGLCHKPLYFEQAALERYGHSSGMLLEPIVSGAHFFGSVVMLPYNLGMDPPWECVYPLGRYRPGDCAPYMIEPFPMSARGIATAGLVAIGLVFLIP